MPNTTHRFRVFSAILMNAPMCAYVSACVCGPVEWVKTKLIRWREISVRVGRFMQAEGNLRHRRRADADADDDDVGTNQRSTRKTTEQVAVTVVLIKLYSNDGEHVIYVRCTSAASRIGPGTDTFLTIT